MPVEASEEDPVYRHSRREAAFVFALWGACLLYSGTYCYLRGYLSHEPHPAAVGPALGAVVGVLRAFERDPTTLTTPLGLGIPDWIFYGVVTPWLVCIVVTFLFCHFVFVEDELGGEESECPEEPGSREELPRGQGPQGREALS